MNDEEAMVYEIPLRGGRRFDARLPLAMSRAEFDFMLRSLENWANYYFDVYACEDDEDDDGDEDHDDDLD